MSKIFYIFIINFYNFAIFSSCNQTDLVPLFGLVNNTDLQTIAINDHCQAIAAWVEKDSNWGGIGDPLVSSFFSNGTWSNPVLVQSDIQKGVINTQEIGIDINNNGDAIIAWKGSGNTIYASYFQNGTWSTEKAVTTNESAVSFLCTLDDNSLINIIYANQKRQGLLNNPNTNYFITSTISHDKGDSWPTTYSIAKNSPYISDWTLAKSDNKKIIISWIDGNRNIENRTLYYRTLINTTLSSIQTIATDDPDSLFSNGQAYCIAINDSENIATGWYFYTNNSTQSTAFAAFFNQNTSVINPTIIQNLNIENTIFTMNMTLSNTNHALLLWNNFIANSPVAISFSAEYNKTEEWKNITAKPNLYFGGLFVGCNNDAGDAVAFFSPLGNANKSIKYSFFINKSQFWTNANELFNDEFIAGINSSLNNSFQPFAFDCKHTAANLVFITPSLKTYVCCNLFAEQRPRDLTIQCVYNRFATQGELFAKLHWDAPFSNDITGYTIYRNNTLIAEVPPTESLYIDHNLTASKNLLYQINSLDSMGRPGIPAIQELIC